MVKIGTLLGLGACLGSIINASEARFTLRGAQAADDEKQLASRIQFDFVPEASSFFVFDLDYSPVLLDSGCRKKSGKYPTLVYKLEIKPSNCPPGKEVNLFARTSGKGEYFPACVKFFSPPNLAVNDASHRFIVWWVAFKYPLHFDNSPSHLLGLIERFRREEDEEGEWTWSDSYCLTAATTPDDNKCRCHDITSEDPRARLFPGDNAPFKGDAVEEFFRHFDLADARGHKLYVIDMDHDDTPGEGGCGQDPPPPGKVVASFVDVGLDKSCMEGTTKVYLGWQIYGCLEAGYTWTRPEVPLRETGREWRVYMLEYAAVAEWHQSATKLAEVLEKENVVSVVMCFEENQMQAFPGACVCRDQGSGMSVTGVQSTDDRRALAHRIRFASYPTRGWVYIIDLDWSPKSWLIGCSEPDSGKVPRVVLKLELGNRAGCTRQKLDRIWEVNAQACFHEFNPPVLRPTESSHRFRAYWTEHESATGHDLEAPELFEALEASLKITPSVTSQYEYCLTFGDDTNLCRCIVPGPPYISRFPRGRYPLGKYPRKGTSAEDFFPLVSNVYDYGGVIYIIDLDYDETPGKSRCASGDNKPSGKIIAIITDVGRRPPSCAAGTTELQLDFKRSGCLVNNIQYSPPSVGAGEIMHEWKIWSIGYRLKSHEGSASDLVEALEARRSETRSLCFFEDTKRDTTFTGRFESCECPTDTSASG